MNIKSYMMIDKKLIEKKVSELINESKIISIKEFLNLDERNIPHYPHNITKKKK